MSVSEEKGMHQVVIVRCYDGHHMHGESQPVPILPTCILSQAVQIDPSEGDRLDLE